MSQNASNSKGQSKVSVLKASNVVISDKQATQTAAVDKLKVN
jgi:hypothetical protein